MYSNFTQVDDKFVPLYRVMWVAAVPHFCGDEACEREGQYEICLEQGESVWATLIERDEMLKSLDDWSGGSPDDPSPPGAEEWPDEP